jgi:flagellar FliL protein
MAKKAKKEKEDQAETGGEGAGSAAKPVGRRKIIMIAAAILVLVGAGTGGYLMLGRAPAGDEVHAAVKKPVSFVDLREMTVNLAPEPNQERQQFLKFRVALEVGDSKTLAEIQPLLPRVEDTFQVFLRELRATDLEGSAGTYRLREELLRRVNIAVYPAKVDAVLFKDIVVQ